MGCFNTQKLPLATGLRADEKQRAELSIQTCNSPASTKTAMTLPANSGEERSWTSDVTSPVDNVMLLDIIDVIDVSYAPMPVYSSTIRLCKP